MENKLHIYAQDTWHTPATIIGDRAAISALINTLQKALNENEEVVHTKEFTVNDGEGYDVRVILLENNDIWNNIKYPYSDPDCDHRNGKIIL